VKTSVRLTGRVEDNCGWIYSGRKRERERESSGRGERSTGERERRAIGTRTERKQVGGVADGNITDRTGTEQQSEGRQSKPAKLLMMMEIAAQEVQNSEEGIEEQVSLDLVELSVHR
jgi:hypothetical protein